MKVFREPEPDYGKEALTFAIGALGGLAVGLLLSRRAVPQSAGRLGEELRERARQAGERARNTVRGLEPGRLQRMAREQASLNELEDAVLDAFFADRVLSERGVDVGAISPGIIELSGSVSTHEEAVNAVRLANSVPGVRTVVNRLDVDEEGHRRTTRAGLRVESGNVTSIQHGMARTGGMGTRRQSRLTDPDRTDDSQHREHRSLRQADRDQWVDEGYAARTPRTSERPEVQDAGRTRYDEDELDNQDPHGQHAAFTLDEQPQELRSDARVGEGIKPGIDLEIEQSGLRREGAAEEGNRGESN